MKGRPVDVLVYESLFPKPRSTDVQNFQSLLHRHLILEVRQEVHSFYGHLDTQEAKYPGLDYCHPIHRIRLSRWPWHRRLFRAFDSLRLTNNEIANLTKWEGTKWAKERFERDSGITIRDTAADDVAPWVEPEERHNIVVEASRPPIQEPVPEPQRVEIGAQQEEEDEEDEEECDEDEEEEEEIVVVEAEEEGEIGDEDMEAEEDEEAEDESDGVSESIGFELNQRLRERAARHEAGEPSEHYQDEWEQWLKNAFESGEFPFLNDPTQIPTDTSLLPQALFPPNMLSAARAGRWDGIPEYLHEIIRQTIQPRSTSLSQILQSMPQNQPSGPIESSILERLANNWRHRYTDIRLPAGGENHSNAAEVRVQRTVQPGA